MSAPVVVSIPHRLGREEAVRRLKSGLDRARADFASVLTLREQTWTGDRLDFRVAAIGQEAHGIIDVAEDHVRLEVHLPWLLAKLVNKIEPLIRRQGHLMLEKK
jgi:hypothetical protein